MHASSNINIGFVGPLPPQLNGIAYYDYELLSHLNKYVTGRVLVSPDNRRAEVPEGFDITTDPSDLKDVDLVHIQVGNNIFMNYIWRNRQIFEGKPLIVTIHERELGGMCLRLSEKALLKIFNAPSKYVTSGGMGPRSYFENKRADILWRKIQNAEAVIVHSSYLKEEIFSKSNFQNVRIVPHGVDFHIDEGGKLRKSLGLPVDRFIITLYGLIAKSKGIEEIIHALEGFDGMFILLGGVKDSSYYRSLRRLLEKTDIAWTATGFVEKEDRVYGYLNASDLIIIPRKYGVGETPGSLLRAMGTTTPVLAADIGPFPEYTKYVVPHTPAAYRCKIEEIRNNKELQKEMVVQAHARIKKELLWSIVSKKTFEIYKSVLEEKKWKK